MRSIALPGAVLGADRALGRGAADRPLLLRRFFAAASRARGAPGSTELAQIDATLVMFEFRQPRAGYAGRSRRHHGRPRRRDLPRTDKAARRDHARDAHRACAKAADTLETRGEFVLVIGPPAADADVLTSEALDDLLREQLATRQRQGCRRACGRAFRPAAPRGLCPRAGAWRKIGGASDGEGLSGTAPNRKSPRRSASRRSAPASPRKAAPPPI